MIDEPPTPDDDIHRAATPRGDFYGGDDVYRSQMEHVFAPSWQLLPPTVAGERRGWADPFLLLPGSLDEPLVLATDDRGRTRCLSNVCTHRGNLLTDTAGEVKRLRCRYHGRCFGLDGRYLSMPFAEDLRDVPRPEDDLSALPLERHGPLAFTSLAPDLEFADWIAPLRRYLGGLDLGELRFDPRDSREYGIAANWALYCDNYLEGLHIPFVHEGLNAQLDWENYRNELLPHGSLQTGLAADPDICFDLPDGHPDQGRQVAAYYFWLFPNLMINAYPWGLSVNVVEPLGPRRTRVRFLSYVGHPERRDAGAGGNLHTVEMEDESVVEAAQLGVRSRLYHGGRYLPGPEKGVHHFHRLLAERLA